MTTVRALIAILAAIVFGVPAAMADAATYTWKGGVGSWNDSTMWATTDAGAAGVPGEGSSVVGGDADSFIELSESVTLDGLTVSSVGKHVFRTHPKVTDAFSFRYAWFELPQGWNVVNGANLPLGTCRGYKDGQYHAQVTPPKEP